MLHVQTEYLKSKALSIITIFTRQNKTKLHANAARNRPPFLGVY